MIISHNSEKDRRWIAGSVELPDRSVQSWGDQSDDAKSLPFYDTINKAETQRLIQKDFDLLSGLGWKPVKLPAHYDGYLFAKGNMRLIATIGWGKLRQDRHTGLWLQWRMSINTRVRLIRPQAVGYPFGRLTKHRVLSLKSKLRRNAATALRDAVSQADKLRKALDALNES